MKKVAEQISGYTYVRHAQYCSSTSIPIALRPMFLAATSVVPLPINGSRMTAPSALYAETIREIARSGF